MTPKKHLKRALLQTHRQTGLRFIPLDKPLMLGNLPDVAGHSISIQNFFLFPEVCAFHAFFNNS
jgi:hypothetical protein